MIRTFLASSFLFVVFAFANATAQDNSMARLKWQIGPTTSSIGDKATIKVPDGYAFLDNGETMKFMELTHNLPNGREYVLAPKELDWFAIFEFAPIGFVKDDETIDADATLKSVREHTERANEERKKRGWETMSVVGWQFPPQYDRQAKLLEWALIGRNDADGHQAINYNTRILGRTGVMNVVVVSGPDNLNKAVATFKGIINGYEYASGEKYSDFRQGDRMAEYGLAALIVGGAAAVATKKGFWAVLAGFLAAAWKFVAAAAVAVLAWIGNLFKKKK